MKTYLRKIFNHDLTHEISISKDVVNEFFNAVNKFEIIGLKTNFQASVVINNVTDPRLGGEFKKLLSLESENLKVDDLILIHNSESSYYLEVISLNDSRYQTFYEMFKDNNRHKIIFYDNNHNYNKETKKEIYTYEFSKYKGINLIVSGTPGSGKSHYVKHQLCKDVPKENIVRTTFFQDYTNTDFVGQILPTIDGDNVQYKFIPGPFTIALAKAIEKPDQKIVLITEELNRGNAPSIFGDIFQLLDRENGVSEYGIYNENIQKYLSERFKDFYFTEIRIPSNLFLYSTMNTSDQNVFTLDTAFKRRWKVEKIPNSFSNGEHLFAKMFVPGMKKTWEEFINTINKHIIEDISLTNSEDKQLGLYFLEAEMFRYEEQKISDENSVKEFAFKVLDYLWNDVAKFDRLRWFREDIKTIDQLIDRYVGLAQENRGYEVFSIDFD
jgi:hypothetical protein